MFNLINGLPSSLKNYTSEIYILKYNPLRVNVVLIERTLSRIAKRVGLPISIFDYDLLCNQYRYCLIYD